MKNLRAKPIGVKSPDFSAMNQSEKIAFMAKAILTREQANDPDRALSGTVIFQKANQAFPNAGVPRSTFLALLSPMVKERTSPINCKGRKQGYYLTNAEEKLRTNQGAFIRSGMATAKWKPRPIPNLEELWRDLENYRHKIPSDGLAQKEVFPGHADLFASLTRDGRRLLVLESQCIESGGGIVKNEVFFHHSITHSSFLTDAGGRNVLEQLPGDDTNRFLQLGKDMLPILARLRLIEPKAFVKAIKKGLLAWQGKNNKPLGMAQEMGLIAELWFLRNILMKYLPRNRWRRALTAWHGQRASPKDFWLPACMFEVKATGPSKGSITISNIDQLDFDEADPPLYLFRISVGKRPSPAGRTLVEYIDEIRKELETADSELRKKFDACLAGAPAADYDVEDAEGEDSENKDWESKGYRDEQRHEYTQCYQVYSDPVQRAFHRVDENFPRLKPSLLRDLHVSVKKYEIQISDCGKLIDEKGEIAELIKKEGNKRYKS